MTIVFPMNGLGNRFQKAGYTVPKPLLPIGNDTLLSFVLKHYPTSQNVFYVFAVASPLFKYILGMVPKNSCIVRITEETKGPTETLLHPHVLEEINKPNELLIADCDSFMRDPKELEKAITIFREAKATGGVTVRRTNDPWASFARIENSWVTETREKDPFTDWSTTGPYWWRHGSDFVTAATQMLQKEIFYVSPCYNTHLAEGGRVKAYEVKTFTHLGTPESYEAYCSHTPL